MPRAKHKVLRSQYPHFTEIFSPSVQANMGIIKVKTSFVVASPQKHPVSALGVRSARDAHRQEAAAMRSAAAEIILETSLKFSHHNSKIFTTYLNSIIVT